MTTQDVITIIQQSGATLSSLINQVAFFFAIQSAAAWLCYTLPSLLLFGVLLKIAKTTKALGNEEKAGGVIFAAWLFFAVSLFTGVRGMAHVAQAALSPVVYVASELGGIDKLLQEVKK